MVNIVYTDLMFFKKGHKLTLEIYNITSDFPKSEVYGLVLQLRRASSSICCNIAEGSVRSSLKDFKNYLFNALGSAKEIEYQLLLSKDLNYITNEVYTNLINLLNEIIGSLVNYMLKIKV